jgi:hypothetical protein
MGVIQTVLAAQLVSRAGLLDSNGAAPIPAVTAVLPPAPKR